MLNNILECFFKKSWKLWVSWGVLLIILAPGKILAASLSVVQTYVDTRAVVQVQPLQKVPVLKLVIKTDTQAVLNQILFEFVGNGGYTSRQIVDNFLFLDKNKNGIFDKKDVELTGGFNFVRPNRKVRIQNFKEKVMLMPNSETVLFLVTHFGDRLTKGKIYNFRVLSIGTTPSLNQKILTKHIPKIIYK